MGRLGLTARRSEGARGEGRREGQGRPLLRLARVLAALGGKPLYGLPEARFERIRLEEGLISFLARPRFWDCRFRTAPRPPRGRTAPTVHWSM